MNERTSIEVTRGATETHVTLTVVNPHDGRGGAKTGSLSSGRQQRPPACCGISVSRLANMFANHRTALGILFLTPSAPTRSSVHIVYLGSCIASLVRVTQTLLGAAGNPARRRNARPPCGKPHRFRLLAQNDSAPQATILCLSELRCSGWWGKSQKGVAPPPHLQHFW